MISTGLTVDDRSMQTALAESVDVVEAPCSQIGRKSGQSGINVFVHLAVDKDATEWRRKRDAGDLVGINDPTPYGYGRAEQMGCRVAFSKSKKENKVEKLWRLALRAILGADVVHALRNREAILSSDIVWTHTESQYLAVAMVGLLYGKRVPTIAQTIWLIDSWDALSWPKKALFRSLVARMDVLTFHSPENYARAKALFPAADVRWVKFGIPAETRRMCGRRAHENVVNILALGNDRHRDWKTLIDAVSGMERVKLKILSGSVPKRLVKRAGNIEVTRAGSNDELREAFDEATLVCVPLRENLHASGITVIQEAVLSGVPVVATDVGGVSAYFSPDEIRYVPVGDAAALRAAFEEIFRNPEQAFARASRAQARMADLDDFGAQAYVRQHVDLSREILKQDRS
ncbi:glycosyltransferase family 4 protein [Paraburkholderia sp. J12]|uniref:glycosyltransferase family 4 protein n=1 Tax=Paraburkholderia sp. J12 TaxID=2805432 RepID=UPI002ABD6451|nr:glycosyltransferase family 4 protein [Paraburkholderia sp. J12]